MSANTGWSFQLSWFSLCVLCGLCGESSSAPPAITSFSPAGAQRGTAVEVTAAGTLDASAKVWASGTGVAVEPAKGKGKFKVTVAKDAVPGAYWLRAHNADGASAPRPFIVGTLPDVAEKEPNDDFKRAQAVEGSCVVNGKLEKVGDVDCFAVRLKKGETLVASLEAHDGLRSPLDGVLQILSADGFVLDENNDFRGLDPQIAFTARKDGIYVARVYAFPATPDSSIRYFGSDACVYRLTLTTGAFADFALPLAVGKDATQVEAEGWSLTPAARKLTLASGGDTFATAFGGNVANPIRVRVESHKCFVAEKGSESRSTRYDLPISFTGSIEKKGGTSAIIPWLKKGQTVSLQVESRTRGLAVNPVLGVHDAELKLLAKAEPAKLNGDTAVSFTPPADGFYALTVHDLYGGGGGPRDYFLLRVLSEPDYDLAVAADRFTVTPGKPTTVAVKVSRVRGFAKPVEITAEGLPAGVKLEATTPAKPDPDTITLSLTATEAWSGSFRLVGTVKDEPKLTRVARATLAEFDETTPDLWLTATPPKK